MDARRSRVFGFGLQRRAIQTYRLVMYALENTEWNPTDFTGVYFLLRRGINFRVVAQEGEGCAIVRRGRSERIVGAPR